MRVVRHLHRPVALVLEDLVPGVLVALDRQPAGLGPSSGLGTKFRNGKIRRVVKIERRGDRDHRLREGAVEAQAARGESVDVGRLDLRRAIGADVVGPQAVDDQDDDVRPAVAASGGVRAASGGGQQRRAGSPRGAGLQQPPAAQARLHRRPRVAGPSPWKSLRRCPPGPGTARPRRPRSASPGTGAPIAAPRSRDRPQATRTVRAPLPRDPDHGRPVGLPAAVQPVDAHGRPRALVLGRVAVVGEVEAERHALGPIVIGAELMHDPTRARAARSRPARRGRPSRALARGPC